MRFLIRALAPVFALAVLAAAPARAASTYDIPVIASLTGGGAFLGQEEQQAIQILEKLVNKTGGIHGRKVRFVFHDDQSSPQQAVQLGNEVLAAKPIVVLGTSLVAGCNAMGPLMQSGPVMYCFSPGIHPPAGGYVFTAGVSTFDQAQALVNYFRGRGWTKLALMTSTDATGQDADKGFAKLLAQPANKGITIVAHPHFNPTDVSVSAQIEDVKAAKPQAFIGWAVGAPSATIFRGAVQGGLTVPMGSSGGNMTYAQMHRFAAFLPRELYLPSSVWAVNGDPRVKLDPAVAKKQKEFFAAFAADGKKPDEGSILGWDPATIVVDALRKLPAKATAAQLRDYLLKVKGIAGVNGVYDFAASPQRGLTLKNIIVSVWDAKADTWKVVAAPTGLPLK
ncbi:MAG: ABC transporter substrate-binding protein [Alphaproteobacteria bacterium]|nr:ABC transporter substrate-binding protein [Alphaproteobacteria bacterium]